MGDGGPERTANMWVRGYQGGLYVGGWVVETMVYRRQTGRNIEDASTETTYDITDEGS